MTDISNEVFTKLKNEITGCKFSSPYQNTGSSFPYVTFEEKENSTSVSHVDTSGEFASDLMFEICIYTTGNGKESSAKKIRNQIDSIMSGFYRMSRTVSEPVPNYEDTSVYRYVLRYSCVVTKNKKLYRS